jgi:hypothetical protein
MKARHYLKMYRVGHSISYKEVMEQFSGDRDDTRIGHEDIKDLKGWWWADPDVRITEQELKEAKPTTLSRIIIIVDGRLYEERSSGKISKSGNIAYISWTNFSKLV